MASHPYISGAGSITQAIGFLRKNFPATVTSETIKKYGIAPNNESYVINTLQFIGLISEDGKRTDIGHKVLTIHNEEEFKKAFADIIRSAYKDLFDIRGEDSWTLDRGSLIGYFRATDKTSDIIGGRQAGVFKVFSALSGYGDVVASQKIRSNGKTKEKAARSSSTLKIEKVVDSRSDSKKADIKGGGASRDMSLTVRVEINLPAGGTRETYDNIFQSIRANLLHE